jgi:hypothetical protein
MLSGWRVLYLSRKRGEVGICALFAQIPGEGASPQALSRKSKLVETPPHPDPLHSPPKTGVNALMASGEREKSAVPCAIALRCALAPGSCLHTSMTTFPFSTAVG